MLDDVNFQDEVDDFLESFSDENEVLLDEDLLAIFLERTSQYENPDEIRLMVLAENMLNYFEKIPWLSFVKTFERARALAPDLPDIYVSFYEIGIDYLTLKHELSIADTNAVVDDLVKELTRLYSLKGRQSKQAKSEVFGSIGHALYHGDDSRKELALDYFSKSLKLDSSNVFSTKFIGHVYHDLGRWKEALQAYSKVDLDTLERVQGVEVMAEILDCKAYCFLKSGDEARARECIDKFFAVAAEILEKSEDYYPSPPLARYIIWANEETLKDPELTKLIKKFYPWYEEDRVGNPG